MPNVKSPSPLIHKARLNRRGRNEAEVRIWQELRRRAIGVRFRRQHPFGPYILDFACLSLKLAIELDGSQHYDAALADAIRDDYLRRHGWTILRFTSHDALANTEGVIDAIIRAVEELTNA